MLQWLVPHMGLEWITTLFLPGFKTPCISEACTHTPILTRVFLSTDCQSSIIKCAPSMYLYMWSWLINWSLKSAKPALLLNQFWLSCWFHLKHTLCSLLMQLLTWNQVRLKCFDSMEILFFLFYFFLSKIQGMQTPRNRNWKKLLSFCMSVSCWVLRIIANTLHARAFLLQNSSQRDKPSTNMRCYPCSVSKFSVSNDSVSSQLKIVQVHFLIFTISKTSLEYFFFICFLITWYMKTRKIKA